jgi:hypothetical protein
MADPSQQDLQNAFGQYYVPPAPNPSLAAGPPQSALQKAFGQYYVPPAAQGGLASGPPSAGPSQAAVANAFGDAYRPPAPMVNSPPPVAPPQGPAANMSDYYKVQGPPPGPMSQNQQIQNNVASLKKSLAAPPQGPNQLAGAPALPPAGMAAASPAGMQPAQFYNPAFQPPPPGMSQNAIDEMGGQGDDSYQKFDAGGANG